MEQITSSNLILQLRQREFSLLEQLDDRYRSVFLHWSRRRFVATPNDLEDAWQEALAVFYEKVMSGELTVLNAGIQTWLFATGGNYLRNLHRKMRRVIWQDDADKVLAGKIAVELPEPEPDDQREMLQKAINQVSPKCRELLRARYFDGFSIPEIKHKFQLASENSTSVQLSKCLAGLKEIIAKTLTINGK